MLLKHAFPLFLSMLTLGVQAQAPGPGTISVDVNFVELHVTARDRAGSFVAGLRREDFHVFEDGRSQTIRVFQHEDTPVSVGLIVDDSSSMGRKRKDVIASATAFAQSSNPGDEMFVVNFNEQVSLGLPAGDAFTADPAELERALNEVPARGMTALYDAIHLGLEHLKKASRERKVLIAISDGGDNASRHTLAEVLAELARSDVMVYTIGIFDAHDADQNPAVMKKLARATGGEAFLPAEAIEVAPICERIAEEIRSQYTIGYEPSNQALDNTYRKIRVTASNLHGGRVFVRTRDGYLASPGREHAR